MLVFDSHCDTPSELLRGRDISIDNPGVQVDLPKLRAGGIGGSFFALYTPQTLSRDEALRKALEMLAAIHDALDKSPDYAALAVSPEDVLRISSSGRTAVCIGMENGNPIGESLSILRLFSRLGVNYLTLTHNGDNAIADSASEASTWGGLSPFGREVVREMNRLGMMIDLSHASDKTFWECMERSQAPIVATHSCCRSLCSHRRNLTDRMLRALGEKGGYVGINFYPYFLSDGAADRNPGVEDIVDHIDRAVSLAGIDHVGIGSDFDGIEVTPSGMEDISRMGVLFDAMTRRGYSREEISKIAGLNLLSVWKRIRETKVL